MLIAKNNIRTKHFINESITTLSARRVIKSDKVYIIINIMITKRLQIIYERT